MRYTLRDYQRCAVDRLKEVLDQRPILVAPTGSGKTLMAVALVEELGLPTLWLAHRKELVDQAAAHLENLGLWPGRIMAGCNPMPLAKVQVASVQTLVRRDPPHAKLVVVDEAHHATRGSSYDRVLEHYPDARVVGLTATPFRLDGRGLGDMFGTIVVAAYADELCKAGVLHDPRVYAGKSPDLRRVRISMGDYALGELSRRTNTPEQNADIVKTWLEKSAGRRTVAFAVDIEHSRAITEAFQAAGVPAEHIDGATPRPEREAILKRLRDGTTLVVSNCMVLTEGWDLPALETAIIARPTASLNLHCLDEQTEVLTREGWKKHEEVDAGDMVAAWHEERIVWTPALASLQRRAAPGERFFSIDSRRMDFRVTDNHRMVWRAVRFDRTKTEPRIASATELFECRASSLELPVSGIEDVPGLPLTDDEVRFIGWVMTDGCINVRARQIHISQSERYPGNLEKIRRLLDGCGFKWREGIRHHRKGQYPSNYPVHYFTISQGKPRGEDIDKRGWDSLGPYLSKDFAPPLFGLNARQFAILLESIHDADGSKVQGQTWTQRSYHIHKGNRTFIERLQVLAVTRGWAANLSVEKRDQRPLYTLHMKRQVWRSVGGKTCKDRPIVTATPATGLVWCVENAVGTLITRRNGKVLVVGNCQMLGRVMRACPAKDGATVLDHAGNHHVHGRVTRRIEYTLDSDTKVGERDPLGLRRCPVCQLLFEPGEPACPGCGWTPEARERERPAIHGTGRLDAFDDSDFAYRAEFWRLIEGQRMACGYRPGWSAYRFKERFGQWPVVADGELVDPEEATLEEKRAVYLGFVRQAEDRGYKPGWAAHRYREIFGCWPRGFVADVRREAVRARLAEMAGM